MKRKSRSKESEIELNEIELRIILGEEASSILRLFQKNIFCTCDNESVELVNYKPYLNDINDVFLKGYCSGCNNPANRYIETGEVKECCEAIDRIKALREKS